MGAWGAIIMGFFGAVFAALTMYWESNAPGVLLALPFAPFAAIAATATYVIRLPGSGVVPSERTERVIMWSSIAEGVGLFVVSTVIANLDRPQWRLPAMALIVGLHFLPIARSASFRPFYVLGTALIVAAAAGFAMDSSAGGIIAGGGAALGLWAAAILAIKRDGSTKRQSMATV